MPPGGSRFFAASPFVLSSGSAQQGLRETPTRSKGALVQVLARGLRVAEGRALLRAAHSEKVFYLLFTDRRPQLAQCIIGRHQRDALKQRFARAGLFETHRTLLHLCLQLICDAFLRPLRQSRQSRCFLRPLRCFLRVAVLLPRRRRTDFLGFLALGGR